MLEAPCKARNFRHWKQETEPVYFVTGLRIGQDARNALYSWLTNIARSEDLSKSPRDSMSVYIRLLTPTSRRCLTTSASRRDRFVVRVISPLTYGPGLVFQDAAAIVLRERLQPLAGSLMVLAAN